MTKTIAQHGAFVICHGAPAPIMERSEVMFHFRPAFAALAARRVSVVATSTTKRLWRPRQIGSASSCRSDAPDSDLQYSDLQHSDLQYNNLQ